MAWKETVAAVAMTAPLAFGPAVARVAAEPAQPEGASPDLLQELKAVRHRIAYETWRDGNGVDGSDGWGNPGIRLTDSQVINYVKGCMNLGASCLVDQCIYPVGSFDPKQYGQMVAVKAAVYGGAPAPIPAPR